jgi:hypothetical protein
MISCKYAWIHFFNKATDLNSRRLYRKSRRKTYMRHSIWSTLALFGGKPFTNSKKATLWSSMASRWLRFFEKAIRTLLHFWIVVLSWVTFIRCENSFVRSSKYHTLHKGDSLFIVRNSVSSSQYWSHERNYTDKELFDDKIAWKHRKITSWGMMMANYLHSWENSSLRVLHKLSLRPNDLNSVMQESLHVSNDQIHWPVLNRWFSILLILMYMIKSSVWWCFVDSCIER